MSCPAARRLRVRTKRQGREAVVPLTLLAHPPRTPSAVTAACMHCHAGTYSASLQYRCPPPHFLHSPSHPLPLPLAGRLRDKTGLLGACEVCIRWRGSSRCTAEVSQRHRPPDRLAQRGALASRPITMAPPASWPEWYKRHREFSLYSTIVWVAVVVPLFAHGFSALTLPRAAGLFGVFYGWLLE